MNMKDESGILEEVEEEEKCRFVDSECTEKCYMYEIIDPSLRMQYCLNCLIGAVIKELKLLRVTGQG